MKQETLDKIKDTVIIASMPLIVGLSVVGIPIGVEYLEEVRCRSHQQTIDSCNYIKYEFMDSAGFLGEQGCHYIFFEPKETRKDLERKTFSECNGEKTSVNLFIDTSVPGISIKNSKGETIYEVLEKIYEVKEPLYYK